MEILCKLFCSLMKGQVDPAGYLNTQEHTFMNSNLEFGALFSPSSELLFLISFLLFLVQISATLPEVRKVASKHGSFLPSNALFHWSSFS